MKDISESYNLNIEVFIKKVLVEEEDLSWSDIFQDIFKFDQDVKPIVVGREDHLHKIMISDFILDLASHKWDSL